MNKEQVKGRVEEVKGKIKEVAGHVVGNKDLEEKGNTQKNAGKVPTTTFKACVCQRTDRRATPGLLYPIEC